MLKSLAAIALSSLLLTGSPADSAGNNDELDAFWAEVSRTVAEGDFEGYARTYHEDAILVSGGSETTYAIAQALDGWKQGFDDTKAGKVKAGVDFRFTQRFSDGETAHETGMFRYWTQTADAEPVAAVIHMQALLVKKGAWLMMMEYQVGPATSEEWEAAAR